MLETAIRLSKVETQRNILDKCSHIIAYDDDDDDDDSSSGGGGGDGDDDDVDLMGRRLGRRLQDIEEIFTSLVKTWYIIF
jgi:hypothetical protein